MLNWIISFAQDCKAPIIKSSHTTRIDPLDTEPTFPQPLDVCRKTLGSPLILCLWAALWWRWYFANSNYPPIKRPHSIVFYSTLVPVPVVIAVWLAGPLINVLYTIIGKPPRTDRQEEKKNWPDRGKFFYSTTVRPLESILPFLLRLRWFTTPNWTFTIN